MGSGGTPPLLYLSSFMEEIYRYIIMIHPVSFLEAGFILGVQCLIQGGSWINFLVNCRSVKKYFHYHEGYYFHEKVELFLTFCNMISVSGLRLPFRDYNVSAGRCQVNSLIESLIEYFIDRLIE